MIDSLQKIAAAEPPNEQAPTQDKVLRREKSSLKEAKAEEIKELIDSWQIMYCGGAAPVVKSLMEINDKYSIPVKVESFAW
jgi:hypothetical protein